MSRRSLHVRHGLALALCIGAIFAAYANSFQVPFLFDDIPNIRDNYTLHAATPAEVFHARYMAGSFLRYAGFVSFAMNHLFFGLATPGYHLTNILIHAAAAWVLYLLVHLTLTLPRFNPATHRWAGPAALACALLWALAPVQTEAVTYIVQRFTSLAALWFLASFLLYIKGRLCLAGGRPRIGWGLIAAGIVTYGLAMLTKENTIVLPLVVMVYEYLFIHPPDRLDLRKLAAMVLLLGLAVGLMGLVNAHVFTFLQLYDIRPFTLTERILTEFRVMVHYLQLIVVPLPSLLNLDKNFPISTGLLSPPATLLAALFLLALLVVSRLTFKRDPLIAFGILWFFINNIVESTIVPLEIVFDHRVYLPSMGIYLVLVVLVLRCIRGDIGRLEGGRP
ncbi:MAG: hypothetical protein ABIF71_06015 [Planctomycetota bacterium]